MSTKSKESETEKTAKAIRYMIYGTGLAFLSMFILSLIGLFMSWWTQTHFPETELSGLPQLVIENVDAKYDIYASTLDKVSIYIVNITVKNIGNGSFSREIILEVVVDGQSKSSKLTLV